MSRCNDPIVIEVDPALEEWIQSIEKPRHHPLARIWTKEEDRRILAAWDRVQREVLAKALNTSEKTLLKRYRELTATVQGE